MTPALAVALLGFFVITLDGLVVTVALPAVGRDLDAGITGLQWVVDGYTLAFAALLLSAGTLADRIGARRAFAAGLVVFVAASLVCAVAPALQTLLAGRLLQGAGAAVITPASLALIREAYPDAGRRAWAIGVWAVGGAVASAAGPIVGGGLSLLSWRLIFVLNVPVGVIAVLLLARVQPSLHRPAPFDRVAQVAAVLGMSALTYGLIEGGAVGYSAPRTLAALALAVLAAAAFAVSQARGAHPMVPPGLFRSRAVTVCLSVGFAFTVGFYGVVFVLSLFLQQQRGLSTLQTGLAFVPMTVLGAVMNLLAAKAAARFGARAPIAAGLLLMVAGLLAVASAAGSAPTPVLALLLAPIGSGGALAVPAATALLLEHVPAERAGTASGVLNTCRQLGAALAVAVFGALLANAGLVDGLRASLLLAALLLLVTAAASLTIRADQHLRPAS